MFLLVILMWFLLCVNLLLIDKFDKTKTILLFGNYTFSLCATDSLDSESGK